jgi:hypothetical protein
MYPDKRAAPPPERAEFEIRVESPPSLAQLDPLLSAGLERIDLSSDSTKPGIGLVFSTDSGDADRAVRAVVELCRETGLSVVLPDADRDASEQEDEQWDIRGW